MRSEQIKNQLEIVQGDITKPSSKLRVPFIPDANVGTDDFSAQRRRGFCDMQRLIAVEGYGQICMGSTLGNLSGIRIDAAGQVYG